MMVSHGDWVQERVVVRKHVTLRVSIPDHDALSFGREQTNDNSAPKLLIILLITADYCLFKADTM